MIADRLLPLTEPARREHNVAKRKSDKLRITEDLVEAVAAVFAQEIEDVTPEQKIAAFDKLRETVMGFESGVIAEFQKDGRYNEDSDDDHYIYEAAVEAVMGAKYFEARNVFTSLMQASE